MADISTKLQTLLEQLAEQIPGFIASGITDNHSGMVLASVVRDPAYSADTASAFLSEAYTKLSRAIEEIGGGGLHEILITAHRQRHLLTSLQGGRYHHHICVRTSTQLGLLRIKSARIQETIESLL